MPHESTSPKVRFVRLASAAEGEDDARMAASVAERATLARPQRLVYLARGEPLGPARRAERVERPDLVGEGDRQRAARLRRGVGAGDRRRVVVAAAAEGNEGEQQGERAGRRAPLRGRLRS